MKLEVGQKYTWKDSSADYYIEIRCVEEDHFWVKDTDGHYWTETSLNNFTPYEEPVKQEWKTFLIETKGYLSEIPRRYFQQYLSIEDAREDNAEAISITEIKLKTEI